MLCACALLPLAAGAKGGHGSGHGGHGSSSGGSATSFSGGHSHGQSGAVRPVTNGSSTHAAGSTGHGSNCASRDERGNCLGYSARAMAPPAFGFGGTPISVP